jgi:hypothetical protein
LTQAPIVNYSHTAKGTSKNGSLLVPLDSIEICRRVCVCSYFAYYHLLHEESRGKDCLSVDSLSFLPMHECRGIQKGRGDEDKRERCRWLAQQTCSLGQKCPSKA